MRSRAAVGVRQPDLACRWRRAGTESAVSGVVEQTKAEARFALNQLAARNGQYEFETLSRMLARATVRLPPRSGINLERHRAAVAPSDIPCEPNGEEHDDVAVPGRRILL